MFEHREGSWGDNVNTTEVHITHINKVHWMMVDDVGVQFSNLV